MKVTTASVLASLATLAAAAQDSRTFAVLRFDGDGFMCEGRLDPIISPGTASGHLHGIMGGNSFGTTVEGDQLLQSTCTSAKIANDRSNYWAPQVFYQDPKNGSFTKVPLFYMNVYYLFEPTDDEIVPFPVGLKMVIGNATTRSPPAFGGGSNLNPADGEIQPVQFTCPRTSYNPASYPADSDGTRAGMQDPANKGAGAGFPLYPCDGYASPLRADIHFPSCYNPAAGLDDFRNNMAWPTFSGVKQNCPSGYLHVPHLFYELYWNTPLFDDLWTPDGKSQPFIMANGDRTGYSLHADFISGWDQNTLKTIIDTCDAGDSGMDTCPQIPGGLNKNNNCKLASPIVDALSGVLQALPGNNPPSGWGVSGGSGGSPNTVAASPSTHATAATSTIAGTATSTTPASSNSESTIVVGGQKPVLTSEPAAASTTYAASELPVEKTTLAAASTTDEVPEPPAETTTSATAVESSTTAGSAHEVGPILTETVYDYVTITQTVTVWAEETAPAKRHEHVDHLARHRRSGHMRR